jgi:thiol-disulfide isomerase/thioredoxin
MRFWAHRKTIQTLAAVAIVCLANAGSVAQSGVANFAPLDPIATADGKPVVLIFLRTDCPVSKRYAPTIQKLAAKYAEQVNFWLVFPSKGDSVEIVAGHAREFGYKLPVLRDPNHILVSRAKATITPEAALFDAHGVVRYHGRIDDWYVSFGRARPAPTKHDLDEALAAVVAGRPVTNAASPAVGCYIADVK